ncbi:MAG: hypothetical protein COA49_05710 [Bacteroidetes bacterium]|nr:MAG: hypothetical protein COA49_05710 [Bacteroidota bacterium]
MCTVSYTPSSISDSPLCFTLVSNRDESPLRKTIAPSESNGIVFPQDEEAGGTWIAAAANGRVCCLLNGAFVKHDRFPNYSRSRGRLILELCEFENVESFFREVNLEGVEPFTLIVVDSLSVDGGNEGEAKAKELSLWEFRWDYKSKHIIKLDAYKKKVWASSTLYSPEIQLARVMLFEGWKGDVLDFHKSNDVILSPTNGVSTVSITQVVSTENEMEMIYNDLVKNEVITVPCTPVLQ